MTRPVIGVTRCSALGDYVASIEQAGGEVRVLEFAEDPSAVVADVDGVLLTGGGDVDPAVYGEARHPSVEDAEAGRDGFEVALARQAMARDVPILGICRGAQVLNVAAGGTLVQDIPGAAPSALAHTVKTPGAIAHRVEVERGSRLEAALGGGLDGTRSCDVNSRHHQSVGRLGDNLVATAHSPDGIVEAIERPDASFCIGVQWHPENFWQTGAFAQLFESFVAAAKVTIRRERSVANDP
jgi:putative glutamine amidotransferase